MQIVGRAFDEATVLRVGHAYERATPWRDQRPTLQPGAAPTEPVSPGADRAALDPVAKQRYLSRSQAVGLELDDQQLADLCQAMPYLERMIARIPNGPGYEQTPSTVFTW
jgi:aspartyl-tRNA(Asn)/glutamyl-tRNA(Gln) amidotransferase subunit A